MSSDATALFPDTMRTTGNTRRTALCTSGIVVIGRNEVISSLSEFSDELLLEQIHRGVKEALGFLFQRHAHTVRNVAHRILQDAAEADDLVQDVFLFIFRKATPPFKMPKSTVRSWIVQITYHRAIDRRRYLKSRHFYTSKELDEAAVYLSNQNYEGPFNVQSMEALLGRELAERFHARLSPDQRNTIHLYFFEGYSLKEIAELTGESLVNVRNRYYRGIERLRKYVIPERSQLK